jgi:hypothetical protein
MRIRDVAVHLTVLAVTLVEVGQLVADEHAPVKGEAASIRTEVAVGRTRPSRGVPSTPDPRGKAFTFRVRTNTDPGEGKPNAWVYVPSAFDRQTDKLRIALIFHGWQNCLDSYVKPGGGHCRIGRRTGYDVPGQTEKSGTKAIVVIPQLAYEKKSSDPGPLGEPGGLRAFLRELVEEWLEPVLGRYRYEDIERVALLASSGGWQALNPALLYGGVDAVKDVYMLDAFYKDEPLTEYFLDRLPRFQDGSLRFGLVYCTHIGLSSLASKTFGKRLSTALAERGVRARFRDDGPEAELAELEAPFAVLPTHHGHDDMVNQYLWRFLRASGL